MTRFLIDGRQPISGAIEPKGSKNAALPAIAATLLTDEAVTLTRLPDIADVRVMANLVQEMGASVSSICGNRCTFKAASIHHSAPDLMLSQLIRASFLLAGPLLARTGSAILPRPGGDRIGRRPLDAHILAFQEMGAEVEISPDSYRLTAPKGLKPADIFLVEMSVMATENILMAAVLTPGTTHIHNAASEPHIQDLCRLLIAMGARIEGVGSNVLTVEGVPSLHGATHEIGPDYLEVGSFIGLAAATGGDLLIRNCRPREHRMTAIAFGRLGIEWEVRGNDIYVPRHARLEIREDMHGALTKIDDGPWPAFPADLVSIALVIATQAAGTILIHEKMFESRLFWVDKLISMGARIILCDPHRAVVVGPSPLFAQRLSSPDIRAGMALVIAALCAEGQSEIQNVEQIDRGYEKLDERLRALGARIERVD
ncbi:UDP-N-acetylglucosamine 1-carboxyvinyltransferase [Nordella sp. HKS 07]|uniref:UDP-N-acetylglucosamine 1-carboxyvinyltransferase n=1 Tax=Nordella sp. HKS 07 TaxID=2712222 RepID=UPI0013E1F6CE|nr:UDP-N-acetylglucosamine 1-carboxyvinyltransferase [Nordella sp. HKS 07]QIG46352.1 UDP-N-acetylglucosamine 1-carboxyvinyltransferase [Nordella sp. HKS 07]